MRKVQNIHPEPQNLLEYVRETNNLAKLFLQQNDLVIIPTDDQCQVTEMPKAMREFAFAAMNTPGPFEPPEAKEAYYWVTPIEPTWSEARVKEHLQFFNDAFINNVTVHEAWPGHYLQLLWSNKTQSTIAKMFAHSYSMIEGWGLYSEEMMFQQGFRPLDSADTYHVGQLIGALVRSIRYISAIKMHCQGMSVAESKQLFMEKAYLTEHNAEIEANRGTFDPMYLNYNLGKLLIKKLLQDYKVEKGDKFSLKQFHDELLSYGSPPITILRNMVLENPGSTADIL